MLSFFLNFSENNPVRCKLDLDQSSTSTENFAIEEEKDNNCQSEGRKFISMDLSLFLAKSTFSTSFYTDSLTKTLKPKKEKSEKKLNGCLEWEWRQKLVTPLSWFFLWKVLTQTLTVFFWPEAAKNLIITPKAVIEVPQKRKCLCNVSLIHTSKKYLFLV